MSRGEYEDNFNGEKEPRRAVMKTYVILIVR